MLNFWLINKCQNKTITIGRPIQHLIRLKMVRECKNEVSTELNESKPSNALTKWGSVKDIKLPMRSNTITYESFLLCLFMLYLLIFNWTFFVSRKAGVLHLSSPSRVVKDRTNIK